MDALIFYDVSGITTTTSLDLGTVAPATSDDTQLRVYNSSGFYQAQDVTVTITGPDATQLWLSLDGDVFGGTAEVGDIPPGGYSPIFWLRRINDSFSITGARTATLQATPASWSDPDDTAGTSDNIPLDTTED
jgi:hypothetical protein